MGYDHGSSDSIIHLEESGGSGGGGWLHPDLITFDVQLSLWRHKPHYQRLGVLKSHPVPDRFALQALTATCSEAKPASLGAVPGREGGGVGEGEAL